MTFSIFTKLMLLGLLEPVIDQNLYYNGLKYTTATFAAALYNILPAITFLMACISRLEKVKLKSIHSQAKVVGTVATVAGAMLMTLVKGPVIELFWTKERNNQGAKGGGTNIEDTIKGSLMITVGCFSWAFFMILQAITLKTYPAELSLTAWICLLGTAQGTLVALVMERGKTSIWSIHWDTKLLTALYSVRIFKLTQKGDLTACLIINVMVVHKHEAKISAPQMRKASFWPESSKIFSSYTKDLSMQGIVCSGLAYYIQGVVMKDRGPVFVTAFSPLSMVIVAVMSSFILAEQMYLGRVIGAIVIVAGLYFVVWGKSKDYKYGSPPADGQMVQLQDKQTTDTGSDDNENSNPVANVPNVSSRGAASQDEQIHRQRDQLIV